MEVIHYKNGEEILRTKNKNGCYINENGTKVYYRNNLLHSDDDLPAIEFSDGDKRWYRKGFIHRIGGHAVEYSNGEKLWYLFGNGGYTEDEYNRVMLNIPLFYWKNRDELWK